MIYIYMCYIYIHIYICGVYIYIYIWLTKVTYKSNHGSAVDLSPGGGCGALGLATGAWLVNQAWPTVVIERPFSGDIWYFIVHLCSFDGYL